MMWFKKLLARWVRQVQNMDECAPALGSTHNKVNSVGDNTLLQFHIERAVNGHVIHFLTKSSKAGGKFGPVPDFENSMFLVPHGESLPDAIMTVTAIAGLKG